MMIAWITLIVLWVIVTEILFFWIARDNYVYGDSFIEQKGLSAMVSCIIVFFTIGLPTLIAFGPQDDGATTGYIAYIWYYGIIISGAIFTYINYLIHKFLEKRKEDKWKREYDKKSEDEE